MAPLAVRADLNHRLILLGCYQLHLIATALSCRNRGCCRVRTARGPRVIASLRNLTIAILRLSGAASIATSRVTTRGVQATPLNDHEVLAGLCQSPEARPTAHLRLSLHIKALRRARRRVVVDSKFGNRTGVKR